MSIHRVVITIDEDLLKRLDRLVDERQFPDRSKAIQQAVKEKLNRMDRSRLARESAKLDQQFEQRLADEGLVEDFAEWPEY